MTALEQRLRQVEREYRKVRYQSLIVDEARRRAGHEGDDEFTYGTTAPRLALRIFQEHLKAGPQDVFYDLGCGLGVPTMVAALICKRATGVELVAELLKYPRAVAKAVGLRNARFVAGDLREADLSDGTVFYSYSTCLSRKTRVAMAQAISAAKPGARIATVTHVLRHPSLELVERVQLRWGAVLHTIFLHVRR